MASPRQPGRTSQAQPEDISGAQVEPTSRSRAIFLRPRRGSWAELGESAAPIPTWCGLIKRMPSDQAEPTRQDWGKLQRRSRTVQAEHANARRASRPGQVGSRKSAALKPQLPCGTKRARPALAESAAPNLEKHSKDGRPSHEESSAPWRLAESASLARAHLRHLC